MKQRLSQILNSKPKSITFRPGMGRNTRSGPWLTFGLTAAIMLSMIVNASIPSYAQDVNTDPSQSAATSKVFLPIVSSSNNSNPSPTPTTSPTGKLITGVVYYDSNTNGVREVDTAMAGSSA